MDPTITTIPEKKVVGIGVQFISILSPERNNHILIPQLWQNFSLRRSEILHRLNQVEIGLCEAIRDPATSNRNDECYYVVCVEVSSFDGIPEGMISRIVPEGRYAIFTHKGKLDKLENTMKYIYGEWLVQSGHKRRVDAPDLEIYDERFRGNNDESELDIYIPLE